MALTSTSAGAVNLDQLIDRQRGRNENDFEGGAEKPLKKRARRTKKHGGKKADGEGGDTPVDQETLFIYLFIACIVRQSYSAWSEKHGHKQSSS